MTIIEAFKKELEHEALTTEKMLALIPHDKWDWQPHPKSMSIRRLANHIAELPGWIGMVLNTNELDFSDNPYQPSHFSSTSELLSFLRTTLNKGQEDLAEANESELDNLWTLREGEVIYSTDTKYEVLRMTYSQIIHHRAQLGVYLRLLDIPIPGSYGPSADEGGN